jgi:hypothetical protein
MSYDATMAAARAMIGAQLRRLTLTFALPGYGWPEASLLHR